MLWLPAIKLPLEIVNLQSKVTTMEASVGEVGRIIQKMVRRSRQSARDDSAIGRRAQEQGLQPADQDWPAPAVWACSCWCSSAWPSLNSARAKSAASTRWPTGLGLNIVGSLPPMPHGVRRPNLAGAAPENRLWQNQLNEAVDAIRTMLLHSSRSENLRVIMITSASGGRRQNVAGHPVGGQPGSSLAQNLADRRRLAQAGGSQSLRCAPGPRFQRIACVMKSPLADAIKPTSLGRLWLMPAGQFDSHACRRWPKTTCGPSSINSSSSMISSSSMPARFCRWRMPWCWASTSTA